MSSVLLPLVLAVSPLPAADTLSPAEADTIEVEVLWAQPTGLTTTPLHFGLNVFQGFNPDRAGIPGDPAYRRQVDYMRPGLIRYCHAAQPRSSTDPNGWVISPDTADYRWDEDKIRRALTGAYPHGPVVIMNIVGWPAFLDDGAGKLRPENYGAFASFCADLVRFINGTLGLGIRYWEVTNEKDGAYWGDCAELAEIYLRAARAMRVVEPDILIGGPAFGSPENAINFDDFVSRTHPELDFISYHHYPSSKISDSDAKIWDLAQKLGTITTDVKSRLAAFTQRPIATFHDEYNINHRWRNDTVIDPRMKTIKGAIFDALAIFSLVRSGVTGAAAWNEGDDVFGKFDDPDAGSGLRPAATVYRLFNRHLTGEVAASSCEDQTRVDVLAVQSGGRRSVALVNRAGTAQRIRLSAFGPAAVTCWQLSASGLQKTGHAIGLSVSDGLLDLPEDSVTVLVQEQTTTAHTSGGRPSAKTKVAGLHQRLGDECGLG